MQFSNTRAVTRHLIDLHVMLFPDTKHKTTTTAACTIKCTHATLLQLMLYTYAAVACRALFGPHARTHAHTQRAHRRAFTTLHKPITQHHRSSQLIIITVCYRFQSRSPPVSLTHARTHARRYSVIRRTYSGTFATITSALAVTPVRSAAKRSPPRRASSSTRTSTRPSSRSSARSA